MQQGSGIDSELVIILTFLVKDITENFVTVYTAMSNAYSTGSFRSGRKRPSKSRHSMDVHTFTVPHLQSRKGGAA